MMMMIIIIIIIPDHHVRYLPGAALLSMTR